ncbi:hypothetical protein B0H19DRAFT_1064643 [Mycena capillaripes]|nr:hypothetical protein B0H19DRAFT_1064643 [Mycena capillaripes]
MGVLANYRNSFKHPGAKYAAEVNCMSPADLQRLEVVLRRQETTLKVSQASLTASAVGITVVSHGLLIHAGAIAAASGLVARHRKNCAHEKLELVRRVMQEQCIQTLPESFNRDVVAPMVLGTAPSIVSGGIDVIGHAATMVPIPSSASAQACQHVAVGVGNPVAPLPSGSGAHQIMYGVVDGAQHEMLVLEHPGYYVLAATGTPLYNVGYSSGEHLVEEAAQHILGTGLPEAANWTDERRNRHM